MRWKIWSPQTCRWGSAWPKVPEHRSSCGKSAAPGSAGSRVTEYNPEDLFMKRRWPMRSAIAFIKSGGTLFPTPAPRWLPTSLNAVSGQLTRLRSLDTTISAADSAAQSRAPGHPAPRFGSQKSAKRFLPATQRDHETAQNPSLRPEEARPSVGIPCSARCTGHTGYGRGSFMVS